MKSFVIDKLSWHTRLDPDPAFQDRVRQRFRALHKFLVSHQLLSQDLDITIIDTGSDFEIKSTDLTPKGLALMQAAYSKWLKRVSNKQDQTDVQLLEKELAKI